MRNINFTKYFNIFNKLLKYLNIFYKKEKKQENKILKWTELVVKYWYNIDNKKMKISSMYGYNKIHIPWNSKKNTD